MKTTDLFKSNRSAQRLNESFKKVFGQRINLETFDLPQLQDARNKLRTQISQVRNQSGFNETIENEALIKAQWLLDAINAEIVQREDIFQPVVNEDFFDDIMDTVERIRDEYGSDLDRDEFGEIFRNMIEQEHGPEAAQKAVDDMELVWTQYTDLENEYDDSIDGDHDSAMASAGFGSDEDYGHYNDESMAMEKAPPGAKAERMVKHIKKGYAKDGKLTDKEKSIAFATAWKQHNKEKNESIESGEDMTKLQEGEVQQASAIVTAKTMVDRVSRWIEELSGMENDTLLQLGDSIRDEMGQEQAKTFISQCAPAIQQALENLKATRETLATGVRQLTGEEQGAEMLGSEPAMGGEDEMGGPAEPDMMNTGDETAPEDEFAAAEPAAGGIGDAGREQRESIERSSALLRILAG